MKTVTIPDILSRVTSVNTRHFSVPGNTAREVVINVCNQHTELRTHLFYENNQFKEHFLFTYNGELIDPDLPLEDGSEINILLATSGGIETDTLTNDEIQRYVRHISLPGVGRNGQLRLKKAKVLIIGAGGLGSPISMYLAASGVGTLGLADSDVVESSNLQRQIIHGYSTLGMLKVDSAKQRLCDLNPYIDVRTHACAIDNKNAQSIISQYDIVVDGTDNFSTRYLVNEICVRLKIPFVYGSISRFEGQVSVFNFGEGPCYNCLFPQSPPAELSPSGRIGGVIGILPGVIGILEATETIKIILNMGEVLSGRMTRFDAMNMRFDEIRFSRRDNCPICTANNKNETPMKNIRANNPPAMKQIHLDKRYYIAPKSLEELINYQAETFTLLDVREENELEVCRLPDVINVPLSKIDNFINKLDPKQRYIVVCYEGIRAEYAVSRMVAAGFKNIQVLAGGMKRWVEDVEHDMPIY